MDLDVMLGIDLLWGANYTIIDGPLKRIYLNPIEDSCSYKSQERLLDKDVDSIEVNLPTGVAPLVKRALRSAGFYRQFKAHNEVYQGEHSSLLTALIQKHVLAHALQEQYMIDGIKESNHQESLLHQAWQDPFYHCKYAFYVPRHTLCYVDPIRFTLTYDNAWIKEYAQVYYDDAKLFALSLKITSIEDFALNYHAGYTSKQWVDYYLYRQYNFKLSPEQIEDIIEQHQIFYDDEKRRLAIFKANNARRRKSKLTHVIRHHQGQISYSNIAKSKGPRLIPSFAFR